MNGNRDQSLAGVSVLIVEDHYALALLAQRTLEDAGAKIVGPCPSLARSHAALADQSPDCAVLDVNLGGEEVYPLADRLRTDGVPFLLASGYEDDHVPARFADCPRLAKPYDVDQLVRAVRQLCPVNT